MFMSYFAKYKKEDGISIAVSPPYWFRGSNYTYLNPTWDMVVEYKRTGDEAHFRQRYRREILSQLDPYQVLADLKDKVILCYEKKGVFCHRIVVAEWIYEKTGYEVLEL